MRKGTAPDANVLITIRNRNNGIILGTFWAIWTWEEWKMYTTNTGGDPYVGAQSFQTSQDLTIEFMCVDEIPEPKR